MRPRVSERDLNVKLAIFHSFTFTCLSKVKMSPLIVFLLYLVMVSVAGKRSELREASSH